MPEIVKKYAPQYLSCEEDLVKQAIPFLYLDSVKLTTGILYNSLLN